MTNTLITPEIERAVTKASESGLSTESVTSLAQRFAPHYEQLKELSAEAARITPEQVKEARALRLKLVSVRTSSDRTREELKKDVLLKGNAIQGFHNILLAAVAPVEKAMDDIEKAEQRREAERLRLLQESRASELSAYADIATFAGMNFSNMTDEAWRSFLSGQKAAFKARVLAEQKAKAELERIAAEETAAKLKAEQEAEAERIRMKAENERLAKIAAEEKQKREAAEKAAREKLEKEQAKAKAEREKQEAQAKVEREKREAAERELAKIAAEKEAKAEAERIAAEKAKAAPDKEKLKNLIGNIRAMGIPKLASKNGDELARRIAEQVEKLANWIEKEAGKL